MSEVLQTNIFFVITSIAVVVLTVLLCFVLYYILGIVRNIRDMTERLRRGSEQLAEDALAVREFVHGGVVGMITKFLGDKRKATPRKAKVLPKDEGEEQ